MKILLLSRYDRLGASSRYRSYQYLPYLQQQGFDITVAPLLNDNYIQQLHSGRRTGRVNLGQSYLNRIHFLLRAQSYDLLWIEKEALPWIPAALEVSLLKAGTPFILDYDDAVFHWYDQHRSPLVRWLLGRKIDRLMSHAALVTVGNDYLAQRARQAGAVQVEIIPTVIDLDRYPLAPVPPNSMFTIGWIGSPTTTRFLKEAFPAIQQFCQNHRARLVAIGASPFELPGVPVEIQPWSEETEVAGIQQFDVGIMPLPDTPRAKGKCGLKLIQYMACSRPILGSPVGLNAEIIRHGINGFQSDTMEAWIDALKTLWQNPQMRLAMGQAGREMVEIHYSLQITAPRLASLLNDVATKR